MKLLKNYFVLGLFALFTTTTIKPMSLWGFFKRTPKPTKIKKEVIVNHIRVLQALKNYFENGTEKTHLYLRNYFIEKRKKELAKKAQKELAREQAKKAKAAQKRKERIDNIKERIDNIKYNFKKYAAPIVAGCFLVLSRFLRLLNGDFDNESS